VFRVMFWGLGEFGYEWKGEGNVENVRSSSGMCGGTLPHVKRKLRLF